MKQWEKRIVVLNNIYKFLLTNNTQISNKENLDEWIISILNFSYENIEIIINKVEPFLRTDWTWCRILPINQAIIIMAYSEKQLFNTDVSIIINEAIKTAKNYSDDASYKFINSILDKIL